MKTGSTVRPTAYFQRNAAFQGLRNHAFVEECGDRRGTDQAELIRAATSFGSSAVEDHQVELLEARGVGDQLDSDNLSMPDGEAEYDAQPSARSPHGAGCP